MYHGVPCFFLLQVFMSFSRPFSTWKKHMSIWPKQTKHGASFSSRRQLDRNKAVTPFPHKKHERKRPVIYYVTVPIQIAGSAGEIWTMNSRWHTAAPLFPKEKKKDQEPDAGLSHVMLWRSGKAQTLTNALRLFGTQTATTATIHKAHSNQTATQWELCQLPVYLYAAFPKIMR